MQQKTAGRTAPDPAGRIASPAYGWVIVAAGALITCIAAGSIFSLAIFLQPMAAETGWSRTGISSAMTFGFLALGVASFGWGMLSDRIGPRPVVLCAAVLLGLGLYLASRAETLLAFQLTFGILVGTAGGAFFAPLIATTANWFERNRALAVSLVSAGLGVAPMTMSPLAGWLIAAQGWRPAMAIMAGLALVVLLLAGLLIRRAPIATELRTAGQAPAAGAPPPGLARKALSSPLFAVLALTFLLCCAAHSGPIFHVVSYAIYCGIAPLTAVTIYSVEGLSGLVGRLLFGVLADRLGTRRVLVAGLLVQALAIALYAQASQLGELYALSVLLGAAYGGVMPLYAVLAREYFDPRILATVLGAATLASSLGMALGPVAGGWAFDRFGAYLWMYLGSALVAFAAMAMACVFPPTRAKPQQGPQAA